MCNELKKTLAKIFALYSSVCGWGGMCTEVTIMDLQVGCEMALIFRLFHFNGIALTKILLLCVVFVGLS